MSRTETLTADHWIDGLRSLLQPEMIRKLGAPFVLNAAISFLAKAQECLRAQGASNVVDIASHRPLQPR